jgi:hypothetical protein
MQYTRELLNPLFFIILVHATKEGKGEIIVETQEQKPPAYM